MKPTGPRIERETIICFNENDDFATIFTASGVWDRKLRKLKLDIVSETSRTTTFKVLKSRITVRKPPSKGRIEAARRNFGKNLGNDRRRAVK